MNKTIWKYQLEVEDFQSIEMPKDSQILTLKVQNGIPCLWVLCIPMNEKEKKDIVMYGTGHDIATADEPLSYIGTYQIQNGDLIFHVFEMVKKPLVQKLLKMEDNR